MMVQSCFVFFRWSLRARGVMADQANVRCCCFGLKSVRCFFYSRLFVAFFPFFFTYASFLESSFIFKWVSFLSWFFFCSLCLWVCVVQRFHCARCDVLTIGLLASFFCEMFLRTLGWAVGFMIFYGVWSGGERGDAFFVRDGSR